MPKYRAWTGLHGSDLCRLLALRIIRLDSRVLRISKEGTVIEMQILQLKPRQIKASASARQIRRRIKRLTTYLRGLQAGAVELTIIRIQNDISKLKDKLPE